MHSVYVHLKRLQPWLSGDGDARVPQHARCQMATKWRLWESWLRLSLCKDSISLNAFLKIQSFLFYKTWRSFISFNFFWHVSHACLLTPFCSCLYLILMTMYFNQPSTLTSWSKLASWVDNDPVISSELTCWGEGWEPNRCTPPSKICRYMAKRNAKD